MKIFAQKTLRRLKKINLVLGLQVLGLAVWLILFLLGLSAYSGSRITYVLFSILTGAMLINGFRQKISYGYLFLTIFLWLGFWLKLTIHAILSYPFVEPVGSFVGGARMGYRAEHGICCESRGHAGEDSVRSHHIKSQSRSQ